jgi:hypothetical protein
MGCNLRAAPKSDEVSKSVTSLIVINAGNNEMINDKNLVFARPPVLSAARVEEN